MVGARYAASRPVNRRAAISPLDDFGIDAIPIGDEEILNFNTASFLYNSLAYSAIGINLNGYAVVGGGGAADNLCCPPGPIPNPGTPNNVLAPFWSDLDGTGAPGIFAGTLTDGTNDFLVLKSHVNTFRHRGPEGVPGMDRAQRRAGHVYVRVRRGQPADGQRDSAEPVIVGAENEDGSAGQELRACRPKTSSSPSPDPIPSPGVVMQFAVQGIHKGTGTVTTKMTTPVLAGTTIAVSSNVEVKRRR